MSRVEASWLVASLLVLAHTHARAEDGPPPINTTRSISAGADDDIITAGDRGTNEPQHPEGTYMGVVPGSTAQPPAAIAAKKAPATITWPGFQMRPDGSSRVFVQSTTPLEPQPSAAPGKYTVYLPGARIAGGVNRLPLETRFFNTPVSKVSLTVDARGATVVLEMRADVAPNVTSERDNTGYYFTYIELPKGNYVSNAKPAADGSGAAAAPGEVNRMPPGPAAVTKHLDGDLSMRNIEAESPPSIKANAQMRGGINAR